MAEVFRAYTGATVLYDALPSGNANGRNTPFWIARHGFGIAEDDVEFIGPWQPDSGLRCDQPQVYLAAWKRPGKVLVAVVNYGEATTAKIIVDGAKLRLGDFKGWEVQGAEADTVIKKRGAAVWKASDQAPVKANPDGTIAVPVKRHNYRQFVISRTQR